MRYESGRRHAAHEERFMNTANLHEKGLLGEAAFENPRHKEALASIQHSEDGNHFYVASEVMDVIKRTHPGDAENPESIFLKDLLIEVNELTEKQKLPKTKIGAYSGLGTPLERVGIKSFLAFGEEVVALGLNERGQDGNPRADYTILGEIPDAKQETDRYLQRVEELAADIVDTYRNKKDPRSDDYQSRNRISIPPDEVELPKLV